MKNTLSFPFILVLSICGLLSSCCDCSEYEMEDHIFKGIITLRAEADNNLGLIKILPLGDEKELEMPNRGIIYKYVKDYQVFNLDTIVYFTVACENDIQYATNISLSDSGYLEDQAILFKYINQFQMNFHNADLHREGPQHKIFHIRAGSRITSNAPAGKIALIVESESEEKFIYFDDNQMPSDLTKDLFINRVYPLESDSLTDDNGKKELYISCNVYTSHEHAH